MIGITSILLTSVDGRINKKLESVPPPLSLEKETHRMLTDDHNSTCSDGVQNGNETGIDCGGTECIACGYDCVNNNPCTEENIAAGMLYFEHADETKFVQCDETANCFELDCPLGLVWDTQSSTCISLTCFDGILNGNETDVDCGGPVCDPCPSCRDGIQNQGETSVDCGGPNCPKCGYNCIDRNPCKSENIEAKMMYFPHDNEDLYVQCSTWGGCFEMPCPVGLVWNRLEVTCTLP